MMVQLRRLPVYIRGDIPSSPVALVASKEFKMLIKSDSLSFGISKYTWFGIREFT